MRSARRWSANGCAVLALLALLLLSVAAAAAQNGTDLAGSYRMDVQGGELLELRADGSAALAGEETTWSADRSRITIGPDVMPYTLQGDRLVLSMGPVQIVWKRVGAPAKRGTQKQKDAPKPPAKKGGEAETGTDREARQLLMSSAWCSFTYNKNTGTSSTRKVVFRQDGIMTVNGGLETYSSGYGGIAAGQSSSSGSMRWKLENLRMYVDRGDGAGFQDIGLTATRNSNGYPILHAAGSEYSMCR